MRAQGLAKEEELKLIEEKQNSKKSKWIYCKFEVTESET